MTTLQPSWITKGLTDYECSWLYFIQTDVISTMEQYTSESAFALLFLTFYLGHELPHNGPLNSITWLLVTLLTTSTRLQIFWLTTIHNWKADAPNWRHPIKVYMLTTFNKLNVHGPRLLLEEDSCAKQTKCLKTCEWSKSNIQSNHQVSFQVYYRDQCLFCWRLTSHEVLMFIRS